MTSARKRDEKARQRPFGVDALLYPCERCGAAPGDRCRKRFSGKWISTFEPHQERVELLKRTRNLRS